MELSDLRRHLDSHFERQEALLEALAQELRQARPRQASESSGSSVLATTTSRVIELPDSRTRELEEHMHLQRGTLLSSMSGLRDSSRTSFVRSQEMPRHMKAHAAATRVAAARERTKRVTMAVMEEENKGIPVKRIVTSSFFNQVIMVLIVANAILLGVEIDVSSGLSQKDVPSWFGTANAVLVFIFVLETVLKMYGLGCRDFWQGEDAGWNIFDVAVVTLSVVEMVIDWWAQALRTDGSNGFRVMRGLRLARTLRGVRIIRLFRYFSALRALILSIFSTMGSLLWTLLLLLILFYTFSCIFTQMVTDHCRYQSVDSEGNPDALPQCPDSLSYWVTIIDSMMTLFMAITGGINWEDAYEPLREVSLMALWLMNLYIVIGFFTILNVVTGVFVNTAIESAGADKDIATLKQMQQRMDYINSLQEVFREIDEGNANVVSIEDLENALTMNKMGPFMEHLGISTDDIWGLFLLIDADHNGVVDLEEFINGCMQLRGPAKSLQVARMSYENKITRQAIRDLQEGQVQIKALLKGGKQKPEVVNVSL